jgi:hypothetical protein
VTISLLSSKSGLAITVVIALTMCGQAHSQARCPLDKQPEDAPRGFVIGGGSVSLPIGAFLLVRQVSSLGAIRLTTIKHDLTVQPRGSEWIGTMDYESYYQPNGTNALDAPNTTKQVGKLVYGRYKGVGFHYSWQPGNRFALVGPWRFSFSGQNWMGMSTYSRWNGVEDRGFEFAPTSACELSEIDPHDSKLKWFRFDRNFNSTTFPLTDLPK